jgi:hypothetical protein
MSSKQLDSILKNIPSATVVKEQPQVSIRDKFDIQEKKNNIKGEHERIVAVIPKELKEEIREYLKENRSATEKTVILKGLKLLGFNVKNEWLIDKRTVR